MADNKENITGLREKPAGAAPVDANQRPSSAQSNVRPSSAPHKGHSGTLHWFAYIGNEAESLQNERVSPDSDLLDPAAGYDDGETYDGTSPFDSFTDPGKDGSTLSQKEREERIRALRDRQNEERQRKLEELKQQALAAQKFREQKEEERRRRIDELRQRDTDRRHQVEERKRQIWEAERDRREAILRKNQEREARIDSKRKNEKSSIVFAFGSSTPRMLEPADTGGSFWGQRRATSTTNVMMFSAAPLTRRSSERELDGSKKRATSASGLDRKPGEGDEGDAGTAATTTAVTPQARVNRRKTDLMPTIPSPRDLTPTSSSRPSSVHLQGTRPFSRSPGLRSGEVTPSPPSRPLSALSQQSMSSVNSGVSLRARSAATSRRPRPISIAVTGVSQESENQATRTSHRHSIAGDIRTPKTQSPSVERENAKPPLPKVHSAKKTKSDAPLKKSTDKLMKSAKASPRVTPKATPLQSPGAEAPPPMPQEQVDTKEETEEKKIETAEKTEEVSPTKLPDKPEPVVEAPKVAEEEKQEVEPVPVEASTPVKEEVKEKPAEVEQKEVKPPEPSAVSEDTPSKTAAPAAGEKSERSEQEVDMSASMIEKIRMRTEEEAKAALAERRRLAREQAEREAELERQRLEEEKRLEEERLRQEEEEQRRFEEEQLRLVEEARKAEEERLLQAIEENQRREEEERKRREEEARAKAEKEEAERKAREEAERLRREMDERLRKEEEERIARRKRVEAIMLRTRSKGSTPSGTPTKGDGDNDDGKEGESPMEETKSQPGDGAASSEQTEQISPSEVSPAQSTLPATSDNITTGNGLISQKQQDLLLDPYSPTIMENGGSEKKVSSSSSSDLLLIDNSNNIKPMETSEDLITSATSVLPSAPQLQQSNGHRNGVEYGAVDFVSVDNVKQNNATNNLLDLSEFDAFSSNNVVTNAPQQPTATMDFEQILDLSSMPSTGKLSNEDNVNSNIMNIGPAPPFIAFQDNLAKKTDTNTVTDLLS